MTIKQLKKRLDKIPTAGPINQARRAAIIAMINKQATEKGRKA